MYAQTTTAKEIVLDSGEKVAPAATLKYGHTGFKCHIVRRGRAYMVAYENGSGTFSLSVDPMTPDIAMVADTLPPL